MKRARNQIQRHRALLRDFCASAATHLTQGGQLWITLLAGHGGTPVDPIQRPLGDHWQLLHEGARAGLLVREVRLADIGELTAAGYGPTGRRQNKKLGSNRQSRGLVVHVLTREQDHDQPAVGPLEWAFDNSFWVGDAPPDAPQLLGHARDALGPTLAHSIASEPELIDAYTRPEDGRKARTYRFTYRSAHVALSRERTLQANAQVCETIARVSGGSPRTPSEATLAAAMQQAAVAPGGAVGDDAGEGVDGGKAGGEGGGEDGNDATALASPDAAGGAPEGVREEVEDAVALPPKTAGAGAATRGAGPACGGRWKQPE